MRANLQQIKRDLKACKFTDIFKKELGWDNPPAASHTIPYKGQDYTFPIVADKKGFVIYQHTFQGGIPEAQFLIQLDKQLEYFAASHLTIFVGANHENQAWLWVKIVRDSNDKIHSTPRLHRYNKNQNGESLVQKIDRLFISLDEEENITLTGVLDRVMQGFDVEKVTKTFYDLFKIEHANFLQHIEGIPNDDEHLDDRKWYTSIMLNRLMFVYFLQKKKVLDNRSSVSFDGKQDYLEERLKKVREEYGSDKFYAFYRYFLRSLFHDGLNQPEPHSPELERLIGKVPHINGGIFDVHELEKKYQDIQIKDEVFERVFKFFGDFHWHLDDRPMREDKEINPDVLGYIFEKYINQKQMGAYYTKEDITEYISKNTIIPFIFEKVGQRCPDAFRADGPIWSLIRTNPSDYIYEEMAYGLLEPLPSEIAVGIADVTQRNAWNRTADEQCALPTETWREVVERRRRYDEVHDKIVRGEITTINDLITYNLNITQFARDVITTCDKPGLLHAFYDAITQVTVLDPTCGSGAFLFAALNILKPLYQTCIERMRPLVVAYKQQQAKLPAMQRNHDNHIAAFQNTLNRIGPHRNQEYFILKTITVNNLYGVDIMEEAIEICKLRLFLKLVAQIETPQELEPLPDIDFNMLAGNTLIGFTNMDEIRQVVTKKLFKVGNTEETLARIEWQAKEIERGERAFRHMQTEQGIKIDPLAKQSLRTQLSALRDVLDPYLATEYDVHEEKYKDSYEKEYLHWKKSYKPFHWWVEFYEIMQSGGFDVVIGNPPWKEYSVVRKTYIVQNLVTERSGNLYGICIERALNLRSPLGLLSFIVQLPLVNSSRMVLVRNLLKDRSSSVFTITFDDRPSKLFEGLQNCRSTIFISWAKRDTHIPVIATTKYQRWTTEVRENIFPLLDYTKIVEKHIYPDQFPKYASKLEASVFDKVQASQKHKAGLAFRQHSNGLFIFYQEATRYWIKATVGLPFYANDGEVGAPPHGRFLYFDNPSAAYAMGALLNSSLFYVYFIAFGDCFHLSDRLVSEFPVTTPILEDTQLITLSKNLMANLKANAERKTIRTKDGKEISYDNYYGSKSKPIIDEIDRILAQHYGFTPEELDFIINYDIKYRMGRDNGEESEE
jgi:hypothetical protein